VTVVFVTSFAKHTMCDLFYLQFIVAYFLTEGQNTAAVQEISQEDAILQ